MSRRYALQVACETGQTEMVKEMLKHGALIGQESVWAACRSGRFDTMKVLIEAGVDISNVEVGILQRYGHIDVIKQLALTMPHDLSETL